MTREQYIRLKTQVRTIKRDSSLSVDEKLKRLDKLLEVKTMVNINTYGRKGIISRISAMFSKKTWYRYTTVISPSEWQECTNKGNHTYF